MRLCFVVTLCCSIAATSVAYESQQGISPVANRLRSAIVTADNSDFAGRCYQELLKRSNLMDLRRMTEDVNIGISLHAYLELQARLAEKTGKLKWYFDVPRERKQRFLGFLEARTGLMLPEWWENAFLDRNSLDEDELLNFYDEFAETPLEIRLPRNTSVEKKGNTFLLRVGSQSTKLRDDVLKSIRALDTSGPTTCMVTIQERYSFVDEYNELAAAFPLICVKSESGKLVWQTAVWGTGTENLGFATGVWFHKREIVRGNGDSIAIFGAGVPGVYLECFEIGTGKNRYRFSSNHWYAGYGLGRSGPDPIDKILNSKSR